MTVRINKQKINLREKLAGVEDKVNFDEVIRGLGGNTAPLILNKDGGNVGIGTTSPTLGKLVVKDDYIVQTDGTRNVYFGSDGTGGLIGTTTNHYTRFITNNTERMIIDSSGNVGIGITDPGAKLEILDSYQDYDSSTTPNRSLDVRSGSPQNSYSSIGLESRSPNNTDAAISTITCVPVGNGSGALAFGTRNQYSFNERMRIDSTGNVGIGTTNPGSYKLNVNGTARVSSGDVTSDDRVKHNEQPIIGALETLSKITPKKYIKTIEMYDANHDFELDADGNPVDSNGEPVEHRIEAGVIAQQVLTVDELAFAVSPEGVDEDGTVTSPHGLDYNSLFTYAIAAIQEQQQLINDLKYRIETLEQQ